MIVHDHLNDVNLEWVSIREHGIQGLGALESGDQLADMIAFSRRNERDPG
jgi:hypothetical protein